MQIGGGTMLNCGGGMNLTRCGGTSVIGGGAAVTGSGTILDGGGSLILGGFSITLGKGSTAGNLFVGLGDEAVIGSPSSWGV